MLPRAIAYDQLKSRYLVGVSDDPTRHADLVSIGRGSVATGVPVTLILTVEDPSDASFEAFFNEPGRTRCRLLGAETAVLRIAFRPKPSSTEIPSPQPENEIAQVRCRLEAGTGGGRPVVHRFIIEARLTTEELRPPKADCSFDGEVAFGFDRGAMQTSHVVLGTITPVKLDVAAYDGPPADLILECSADVALEKRSEAAPLPVQIGIRVAGSASMDDVLWSGVDPSVGYSSAIPMAVTARRTVAYPFGKEAVEFVVGVPIGDAVTIARTLTTEPKTTAKLNLHVRLTLAAQGPDAPSPRGYSHTVYEDRLQIAARFNTASVLTVWSRDFGPVILALTNDRDSAPMRAAGKIQARLNLQRARHPSNLETAYALSAEVFPDTGDPRLDADFSLDFEGEPMAFPEFSISDHEPRRGKSMTIALRDMIERAVGKSNKPSHLPRRGSLVVSFRFFDVHGGEPSLARLKIPIEVEEVPPELICCVDLGTSATSVWFGRPEGLGAVLPLGSVVHAITGDEHEEYDRNRGIKNVLLPSLVGLSSDRNLRARYDPLSLGDIGLAVDVKRRLNALCRRYDVSLPFVARQDIPANHDKIVFHPKRSMIAPDPQALSVKALEMVRGEVQDVSQIAIPELIVDIFDELGAYLVPRAMTHLDEQKWRPVTANTESLADLWLDARHPIGVIVTYPSGINSRSRQTYVDAGRRFLSRFIGHLGEGGAVPDSSALWVKLVPEAIAAINFGIGFLLDKKQLPAGTHVLAALDIGAGTYDATLIEATIGSDQLESWTVLSHFGVTVGGIDLDNAIAAKVADLLNRAFEDTQINAAFSLERDVYGESRVSETETERFTRVLAFQDEVQRAKKRLTSRMFARPDSTAYEWSSSPGVLLDVVVGREPDKDKLPVRRRQTSRPLPQRFRVDSVGPTDLVVRQRADGISGAEIVLEIGPGHFTPDEDDSPDASNPKSVVRFLGSVLPRMILREVARLKVEPPTWIVTGRTALWPPLFSAISGVVKQNHGSRLAFRRPWGPDEMKEAVIRGALTLAASPHLPLGDDILNPLAIVSMMAAAAYGSGTGGSIAGRRKWPRRVHSISYLTGSDKSEGSDSVECSGTSHLVRALPGLADPALDRPDEEALRMFECFSLTPYEVLLPDIAPTRGIHNVSWSIGDRNTRVSIETNGRSSGFIDVPNRDSRVYHD